MHNLFNLEQKTSGNEEVISKINLITSFYKSRLDQQKDDIRNKELEESLYHNIKSPVIEKIHLFVDDEQALQSVNNIISLTTTDKINIISVGAKPLYSDLFAYAQNNLSEKICMVSNSDIFIYEYDINILNKIYRESNICFSLTRYESDLTSSKIDNFMGSHDCFIFKSPINNLDLNKIAHVQHYWGSENIVIHELEKIGIKFYNPCYQIKIVHLHSCNLREDNRPRINLNGRSGYCFPIKL
jgi:hypothetical protein